MKVSAEELWSFIYFWMVAVIFVLSWDNDVDHVNTTGCKTNFYLGGNTLVQSLWYQIWPEYCCYFFPAEQRFFHYHKMKWSGRDSSSCFSHTHMHTQPLLMSWLCLLVVHSMIEMGVWVLSGRKSACQLAFSALFPISIKHSHHLLWAHSTTPRFSPEPCSTDRWCVLGTNHFSNHTDGCLTLCSQCSFTFWEFWMGFGRLNGGMGIWALTLRCEYSTNIGFLFPCYSFFSLFVC